MNGPRQGVAVVEDRTVRVPAGATMRTGYVPMHRVRLACADRMAVGDVDRAYQRRLQLGSDQPWPPPVGTWEEDPDGGRTFVVLDGRHDYVAALMVGVRMLFVAWLEPVREFVVAPGTIEFGDVEPGTLGESIVAGEPDVAFFAADLQAYIRARAQGSAR